MTCAIYKCIETEEYPVEKVYLNCYELDRPLPEDAYVCGLDIHSKNLHFYCSVLFNPEFTKCKINAKIYHANGEFTVELDEEAQETALILVNHVRIFEGEDPLDCVIEN